MNRGIRIFAAICVMAFAAHAFWGCGRSSRDALIQPPPPVPSSSIKVRVADVSNNTGEIYNVDVIGMMWSALDEALRKQGMLWKEGSPGVPLDLELRVLFYNPGNVVLRYTSPIGGKTSLNVKGDVKDSGQVVATVEANQSVSLTKGLTLGAYKKIFPVVAEDLVRQIKAKVGANR